jgi:hypothetical protein
VCGGAVIPYGTTHAPLQRGDIRAERDSAVKEMAMTKEREMEQFGW